MSYSTIPSPLLSGPINSLAQRGSPLIDCGHLVREQWPDQPLRRFLALLGEPGGAIGSDCVSGD